MKLKELKDLKKISKTRNKKRILLVNPHRLTCSVNMPHMGLAILASILKKRGHEVLVIDYQLIHTAPNISTFLSKFNPDMIGVSMVTANVKEAEILIKDIRDINAKIPVIVGGPHATLYPEYLEKNKNIDYIVKGEAEPIIIDLIEKAKRHNNPKVIYPKIIIDPNNVPYADYKLFYKWKEIRSYPIMTSRGCPYNCSFCPVAHVGQKKWRPRKPEDCIKEIELAKKELNPHLHILIQDDNSLVIPERFYKFLELFAKKIKLRLAVTNIRADDVNDKLLVLLKKAGCSSVGIGVESANPEVFKLVNKGEPFEAIDRAANLIKKHKMLLSFCYVIGLPADNLERVKDSIKFANKHKPDSIYWNMTMPYKNTAIRKWFEKHGKIYDEIGKTSLTDGDFRCDEPAVETPDFTIWERKKAHYMCLFRTVDDRLKISKLPSIFNEARKYKEIKDFFYWLPRGILKSAKRKIELIGKFRAYVKREGIKEAIKRSVFLLKG